MLLTGALSGCFHRVLPDEIGLYRHPPPLCHFTEDATMCSNFFIFLFFFILCSLSVVKMGLLILELNLEQYICVLIVFSKSTEDFVKMSMTTLHHYVVPPVAHILLQHDLIIRISKLVHYAKYYTMFAVTKNTLISCIF